jgi:hypothetical protein
MRSEVELAYQAERSSIPICCSLWCSPAAVGRLSSRAIWSRLSSSESASTFSELARALDAPKGSVHGFIGGLLATGWLYEQDHRFYLGPAV